jgi:indole-3-glycerol phosphate synthase
MNILDQIVKDTRKSVAYKKMQGPLKLAREKAAQKVLHQQPQRFLSAINTPQIQIIAEVKRASPSKGLICHDFNPLNIAKEYEEGGAAAISVLTEEKYFQGHVEYLKIIAEAVSPPVLRKDFIVDEYQIYEAAVNSASAILLIAAILSVEEMPGI